MTWLLILKTDQKARYSYFPVMSTKETKIQPLDQRIYATLFSPKLKVTTSWVAFLWRFSGSHKSEAASGKQAGLSCPY